VETVRESAFSIKEKINKFNKIEAIRGGYAKMVADRYAPFDVLEGRPVDERPMNFDVGTGSWRAVFTSVPLTLCGAVTTSLALVKGEC